MRLPAPVSEGGVAASVPCAPEAGVEEPAVLCVRRHVGSVVPHPSSVRIVARVAVGAVVVLSSVDRRRQPRRERLRPWPPRRGQEADDTERGDQEEAGGDE